MEARDMQHPPSPIQRILIFHLNFYERCMDGKSLGESASVQEICEQILYYHRERHWGRSGSSLPQTDDEGSSDNSSRSQQPLSVASLSEEAVQFLGLCTALYTLPPSLGSEDLASDRTKEIYFGNSTLVFVPLEDSTDLVAVVQVSRLYQHGKKKSGFGGGNPLAIRQSIERCHRLFCILRGGGIIRRLRARPEDNEPLYAGMDRLFTLLKSLRRVKDQIERGLYKGQEPTSLTAERDLLEKEIKALRKVLPIQGLRRDLDLHYTQYVGDLSVVSSRNGGSGRCIVDTVPVPIAQNSLQYAFQSLPPQLSSSTSVSLGLSIRRLILDASIERSGYDLLGVVSFFHGQLLFTHLSNEAIGCLMHKGNGASYSFELPGETACSLMGYMASHRTKMTQLSKTLPRTAAPGRLGLKRLAINIGSITDGTPAQSFELDSSEQTSRDSMDAGRFVHPPPSFMLDTADHSHYFDTPSRHKVWAPKVSLPLVAFGEYSSRNVTVETHAVMYEHERFDFLILLVDTRDPSELKQDRPEISAQAEGKNVGEFLSQLQNRITEAFGLASEDSNTTPEVSQNDLVDPGQDLILVDRAQHRLVLFSDRKQFAAREGNFSTTGKRSSARRFLGLGSRKSQKPVDQSSERGGIMEWAALGLDCRHLLASHLHLDVILAFDDMMNEITRRKEASMQQSTKREDENDYRRELCTCMPLGWVYAFSGVDMDLFVFFDSSTYVTVADVQSAASKVRSRLFGLELADDSATS